MPDCSSRLRGPCEDLSGLPLGQKALPEHYLLYPVRASNLPTGRRMIPFPDRPMQPSTMHRWWGRCLEQAAAAHFPMHELRRNRTLREVLASPRRRADSNRCTRLCRPLPNLSATAPGAANRSRPPHALTLARGRPARIGARRDLHALRHPHGVAARDVPVPPLPVQGRLLRGRDGRLQAGRRVTSLA